MNRTSRMSHTTRPRSSPVAMLALCVLAFVPSAGCAQSDPTRDPRFEQAVDLFEAWLDAKMDYEKLPAVSVGLVHDQDLVWAKGYGYAHPDAEVPATPSTMYSICSISKLFTSIGVMQQRDAGKLRLDDPVSAVLPWYDLEQVYPDGPAVSVEGILTHSSGLPRESAHPYWTGPDFPFPTREEIIEGLAKQETLYPGDRYFQYSNLGMALAGQIVEQASGMSYDDYIRAHILDPLGMADTYTDIPEQHKGDRFATGYTRLGRDGQRHKATFFQSHGIAPAAGFASTVEDLARLASWQFRLLEDGGTEVLAVNTLREMHRVHWVDPDFDTMWGLGFAVGERDDERTVGHGGSCPGFRTTFQLKPAKKLAGIAMISAQGASPDDVWSKMMSTVGAALESIQADPGGGTARPASLTEYEGLYESNWGETVILRWDDGIVAVRVPNNDPMEAMTKLRRTAEDTYQRVRDDGELGEAYVFQRDDSGAIESFTVHGNYSRKVR
ncbi:MAG: serine hydrolase [Gemmatimonadota bacterium]|nr:serine hydrolase [Gemmatimonadota bacterium]